MLAGSIRKRPYSSKWVRLGREERESADSAGSLEEKRKKRCKKPLRIDDGTRKNFVYFAHYT